MNNTGYFRKIIYSFFLFSSFTGIAPAKEILIYGYEVINVYPHDPTAFTQGLVYYNGNLYESTGNYGHSSLRKVDLETGKILQNISIDKKFFAEGLTIHEQRLMQLTWRAGKGFIYGKDNFVLEKTVNYPGEGWGITSYQGQLIISDGSSMLRFLDPVNFTVIKQLQVFMHGRPVKNLNELEMVNGDLFANVWQTNKLLIISPQTGQVTGVVNLAGLLKKHAPEVRANVLNGIAYDAEGERLFVTGKNWPKLFEIKIVPGKITK